MRAACLRASNGALFPRMTITIPDEAAHGLTPEIARLELAVGLFAANKASVAKAAKIAGLDHLQMQRELGRRRIPMHYTMEDYEADMRTIRDMPPPQKQ